MTINLVNIKYVVLKHPNMNISSTFVSLPELFHISYHLSLFLSWCFDSATFSGSSLLLVYILLNLRFRANKHETVEINRKKKSERLSAGAFVNLCYITVTSGYFKLHFVWPFRGKNLILWIHHREKTVPVQTSDTTLRLLLFSVFGNYSITTETWRDQRTAGRLWHSHTDAVGSGWIYSSPVGTLTLSRNNHSTAGGLKRSGEAARFWVVDCHMTWISLKLSTARRFYVTLYFLTNTWESVISGIRVRWPRTEIASIPHICHII